MQKTFRVRVLSLNYTQPIVVINEQDALEQGIAPGSVVLLTVGTQHRSAVVLTTRKEVGKGECAVSEDLSRCLGLSEGNTVGIRAVGIPQSFTALKKRLKGERLSELEFLALIRDIVGGLYGEAEIASFLVSQLYSPLSDEEVSYLIKAMVEAGTKVKFEETAYDIHSIGGVPGNSKVALLSVPIVASTGILIPKTSSRAIMSPAGTADTMEVLARVDLAVEEIVEIARKVRGTLVWGGRLGLAPADDIFVNIERKLAIDPDQQMVASILSKKIAMGIEKLVVDIPIGRGTKVEDIKGAERLSSLFIKQAGLLNIVIKVALTYGGQPIGMSVGPALEAREALKSHIERRGSKSFIEKALLLAGLVLELGGKAPLGAGIDVAREIFLSGKAYEKFKEIVEAQGGNPNIKPEDIPVGRYTYTVTSPIEGAVTHIDNFGIALIARTLGAPSDKGAGIELHAKVGYRVNKGDPLLTLYSNSEARIEEAISLLREAQPILVEGMLIKVLP